MSRIKNNKIRELLFILFLIQNKILAFEGLFVEGHNAMPDKAQEIKENAIARAKDLAHTF